MQTLVTGIRAQRRLDLGTSSRIPNLAQLGGDALSDELFRLVANEYPGDSYSDIEDSDGIDSKMAGGRGSMMDIFTATGKVRPCLD